MKLLLTSNGLANPSIVRALNELTGKEPEDTKIIFIPTASFYVAEEKSWFVNVLQQIVENGYQLDIVGLGELPKERIKQRLEDSDVIFVCGGSTPFLSYWFQRVGLFDELPDLLDTRVYVGQSAGGILASVDMQTASTNNPLLKKDRLMTEATFDGTTDAELGSDKTFGFVDFCVRPHYNSPDAPKVIDEVLEKVAQGLEYPMYAIDDQTAIKIDGEKLEVVSEGEWKLFE